MVLAFIPALCAFAARRARGRWPLVRVILVLMWLVFLPNAPYIVTDFVHLAPRANIPLWYDIALLISFASVGLFFAYTSVADVQAIVERNHGRASGWCVAVIALLLSGFGIYLGRFLRWNSWEVMTNPRALASEAMALRNDYGEHRRSVAVTLTYGVGLTLGYLALNAFAEVTRRSER